MDASNLALVQGMRQTRGALRRWGENPFSVLSHWFSRSMLIAVAMLAGVWVVSSSVTGDPGLVVIPGVNADQDFFHPLARNMVVLALHATACVAGFMAGSSMPMIAKNLTGVNRVVHEKAGPIAILWVIAVTGFSLVTQTYLLGFYGASIAERLDISTWQLILTVLPHALLELTAVFLPLAAWLIASRKDEWEDLLAATFVTVAVAIPMLLVAATIETVLWPELLVKASPLV